MGERSGIRGTDDPFLLGVDRGKPKNGKPVPKKVTEKVTIEEDPFLLGVKKKESETVSEDTGTPSQTGTENTLPYPSLSPSEVAEGVFSFSKFRTKEIAYPANVPKIEKDINSVLRKVHFGDIKPQELSELYNTEFGKPVVQNIIRQYAPEIEEQYRGSGESLEVAAKNVNKKNRINFVNAEKEGVSVLDNKINESIIQLKNPVSANKAGRVTDYINELRNELNVTDYTDNSKIAGLISQVKKVQNLEKKYYLTEKERSESLAQTTGLVDELQNRLNYNISKQGVTPTLNQLNTQIEQAVISKVSESERGTGNYDVLNDNEKINHLKLGLTAVEKTDPVLFKNVVGAIAEKKKISDTDFSNISNIGQQIANVMKFRGGAYDTNLIGKETYFDYRTFGQKVSEAAGKIGEWAKSKGYKNRAEFSEDIIRQGAKAVGEDNPEVVKNLVLNEKLKFYDAIPKAGWADDIASGIMEPLVGINSTLNSWNESPAETYLRSKAFDATIGGQKVPDEKGEISDVLPSERGRFTTDMFRGLGQFIPQVLLTKGIGSVAKGATILTGVPLTANRARNISDLTGTAISTFLQSYGPAYEEHLQKTGDADTAALIATIDGVSSAAFETFILPDVRIADKAFRGLKQGLASDLATIVKKGGDPADLAKQARPFVQKFFTNATSTLTQENLEELGTQYVDFVTESIFDPASAKDRNLNKELWDAFKATSTAMILPSLLGAGGQSVQKDFTTKSLNSAAINFESYKESLQNSLDKGYIDQDQYNGSVQIISTHRNSIAQTPKENINGVPLSQEQQFDYALEDTKSKVYRDKASKAEGVTKQYWEAKLKDTEAVQKEILMPEEKEISKPKTEKDENKNIEKGSQESDVQTGEESGIQNEGEKKILTSKPSETPAAITTEGAAENVVPSTLENEKIQNLFTGEKTTEEIISGLQEHLSDRHFEEAVGDLIPYLKSNPNIRFSKMFSIGAGEAHYTGDWTVLLSRMRDKNKLGKTVLHELYHAISINELQNNKEFESKIDSIVEGARKSLGLEDYFKGAKNTDFGTSKDMKYYGLLNSKEFIAEIFSNKEFSDLLDKTKIGKESVLDKVISFLKKAFGVSEKSSSQKIKESILEGINTKIDFAKDNTSLEVANNYKKAANESEFVYSPVEKEVLKTSIEEKPESVSERKKVRVTAEELEAAQPTKNEITSDTVETETTVTDDATIDETVSTTESDEGGRPPTETVDTGKDEGDSKERRQFSEQILSDKKILPQVKRGMQNAIEYTRQTNRMSVEEAEEILKRVGIDEAYNLVTNSNELKPAVRVVLGQAVIKGYNQLAKEAKDSNLESFYLDKTIDTANYVSEKLGTESGQMVQAFSLWSRLTPEAQLRSASKEKREQGKKQILKVKNDINVVGDKLKQANEEAAEEISKSTKKKESVKKAENQKVKKAKDKVQAAKDKRSKLIEQRKKDKGKGGALFSSVGGLTPEGIEFVGNVAATYIQEGAAKVQIIVERIKEHLKDISGKDPDESVVKNITDIVNDLVLKDQNKKIISGLSEMEQEVSRLVKEHYTVPEETKTSLVNKFMDNLDLDKTDAEQLAKEIQSEFDNIVKRKKDNILYTEKARFDRIQKGLNPKKDRKTLQDDVLKYSNLGAFDNNEFADFIAKKMDVGKLTAEEAKQINKLSEKIQKAPEGSPKNDATQELLAYRANMNGIKWMETLQAVWYANILSGYATHLRNIVSTFFNGMAYFGAEAVRDPKSIPVLAWGAARGANRGIREAWHTLSTGKSPIHISKVETPGTLERQQFIGGFLNPYNYLKFVGRLMSAEDVLQFQALKEMRATQLAYREAKKMGSKNPFSKTTWDYIDKHLLNTPERTALAFEQAKEEGYTEKSVERKRRVYELMENSRPIQMTEDAYGFAARGTFNFEPEGTLGAITNAIGTALNFEVSGARPLRFFVPFTRIITNVVNNSLDFGPWGLIRAARGGSVLTGTKYRQLTPEQKNQLIARASLGIGLTGAIFALTKVPCKDGHNVLDITGAGTGDFQKDAQLKETGWQPYSIRVCGGNYFSYKYTPLIFNLGFIGYMNDNEKYGKDTEENMFYKTMGAMYQTGQLALDGTWVGSTSDLMKSIAESKPAQLGKNIEKTVSNMALQAILPNAYVQGAQLTEEWMQLPKKEAKTFYERLVQHIPVVRNTLNDKLNTLGEPILTDVDIFKTERKPHKVYDFLIDKKQWIAPVNKNSMIVWDTDKQIERPVTDDEYYIFSKRRGELIKQKTETLIDNGVEETTADGVVEIPANDLNTKQIKRIMRKIKTEASKQAKLEMFDKKEKESSKYKLELNDTDEE